MTAKHAQTMGNISPPGPYTRFLLRRGDIRGRQLAVLVPSLVYLGLGLYPLVEIIARMLLFNYNANQGELIGKSILAGIGLTGATINVSVMWVMTGPKVTTIPWWNMGLTVPLLVICVLAGMVFGSPSDAGYAESVIRGMARIIVLLFGYLRLNGHAGFWPLYRAHLPQSHP